MSADPIMMTEEPTMVDRSIHFLIPALSADEPSHILSLPETFAIEQNPLEIPLPSGKYILAPSPSELFHYYESVQPQMNSIIASSEGIMNPLTSENFLHLVENLSEYSIPCPILQSPMPSSVDKSTSMMSMDELYSSQPSQTTLQEDFFRSSPSYEACYIDPIGDYTSTMIEDPNLFIHHEQLISSSGQPGEYYPSETSFLNQSQSNSSHSSSTCDVQYSWTSLPVSRTESSVHVASSNELIWKSGDTKKKGKVRNSRKRTKFSSEDLEILNLFFEKNPMPTRTDISILSERLAYPRYIVQVWFYNKRQSLKRANSSSS